MHFQNNIDQKVANGKWARIDGNTCKRCRLLSHSFIWFAFCSRTWLFFHRLSCFFSVSSYRTTLSIACTLRKMFCIICLYYITMSRLILAHGNYDTLCYDFTSTMEQHHVKGYEIESTEHSVCVCFNSHACLLAFADDRRGDDGGEWEKAEWKRFTCTWVSTFKHVDEALREKTKKNRRPNVHKHCTRKQMHSALHAS